MVDNGSRDGTAEAARQAGARVIREPRQGKCRPGGISCRHRGGLRLRLDGDDTYPADAAPAPVAAGLDGADQVVGTRLQQAAHGAFPAGHSVGNRLFIALVRLLFGVRTGDLFSGYRLLSRRFLRTAPLLATGFEIEAGSPCRRPGGGSPSPRSPSTTGRAARAARASSTPGATARASCSPCSPTSATPPALTPSRSPRSLPASALLCGWPVLVDFAETGLVHRLPLAVLAAALFVLAALSFSCGVILSSVNRRADEGCALIAGR